MSMGTEIGYLHDASLKKTEIASRIMGAVTLYCRALLSSPGYKIDQIVLGNTLGRRHLGPLQQLWAFVGTANYTVTPKFSKDDDVYESIVYERGWLFI